MSLKECLLDSLDCVTSIREELGAELAKVYLVQRRWTGTRPGDGNFKDTIKEMHPYPEIVDYSHDIRAGQGSYKQGDLILRTIPESRYSEEDLRTDTGIRNIEKFIKVGDHFYRTIHIKKKFITWDVHIRKVSQDESERK